LITLLPNWEVPFATGMSDDLPSAGIDAIGGGGGGGRSGDGDEKY
jgi:hypothetical protein